MYKLRKEKNIYKYTFTAWEYTIIILYSFIETDFE